MEVEVDGQKFIIEKPSGYKLLKVVDEGIKANRKKEL